MFKSVLSFLSLVFICFIGMAQERLTWNDFADVSFEPVYNASYDTNFLMPSFGKTIESYRGKKIRIKGYFLDISGSGEVFLVSKNPMASCFFCGGAGPETIIEVHFTKKPSFKTDQIVSVAGILELNKDDVDYCNYILKGATGQLIE